MVSKLFYKTAYQILRIYWFIFHPTTFGVKTIIECNGEWLLIKNTYGMNVWTFPGGGIHRGETPEDAAKREVREEVGIDLAEVKYLGQFLLLVENKKDNVHCFHSFVPNKDFNSNSPEVEKVEWFNKDALPGDISISVKKAITLIK